jgi:hypothetical protein
MIEYELAWFKTQIHAAAIPEIKLSHFIFNVLELTWKYWDEF